MTQKSWVQFSISPVQQFIESARTVRDLWTGSYLLSWLTARAMAEAKSRGAILGKSFAANPLVRLMGGERNFTETEGRQLLYSCLPNTFVIEIEGDEARARSTAEAIECAVREEWGRIADAVRNHLKECWRDDDWDLYDGWKHQTEHYWSVQLTVLPAGADLEGPAAQLGIKYEGHQADDRIYFLSRELIGRAAAARKMVRYIPPPAPAEDTRPKCALFGTESRMGPRDLGENDDFWQEKAYAASRHGEFLQPKDRLGAVGLVKRFAWSQYLSQYPGLNADARDKRSWDTATIAAAGWLRDLAEENQPALHKRIDQQYGWSGQWLHWNERDPWAGRMDRKTKDDEPCPEAAWNLIREAKESAKAKGLMAPPTYYAMLMLDGDHMGDLLRRCNRAQAEKVSAQLQKFALEIVPEVIADFLGEGLDMGQPIYAGGDDVLAMLPLWVPEPGKGVTVEGTVLDCADCLNRRFAELEFDIPQGAKAPTTSAGLVIAHYKSDLRDVLRAARAAEKTAKNEGRYRLTISAMRRSGEHSTATITWDKVRFIADLIRLFMNTKVTDRWAYQLRPSIDSGALSTGEMIDVEFCRLLSRSEMRNEPAFYEIWTELHDGKEDESGVKSRRNALNLILTASFMARAREV